MKRNIRQELYVPLAATFRSAISHLVTLLRHGRPTGNGADVSRA